ncbi:MULTISPECIES: DUF2383 domain-containing protein [Vibrio]|uniref:DUF2383 domain-containing protein n=1 Tax=Vibrio casei TaxID=673372 RepID=A0A368LJW2_9VIBR|nr:MULTISPECIES: DUF2383 domain-containing protein [Vibrio]RCS70633.1 DUF2383 domain-containing protein [Vibrio casei]SJN27161.1 hypothetical protein FM109_07335 [Vibrio casei]HBV77763.1 DUF2383 domain-containing protein [Vibrio sp.]
MKNNDITSIIELIESGNIIYEKAINNMNDQRLVKTLFDIYSVKMCATMKLRPLFHRSTEFQDDTPVSYTIKARERYIDMMENPHQNQDALYLRQLKGVESKILLDIENLLEQDPQWEGRGKLITVKDEMKRCHKKINKMYMAQ